MRALPSLLASAALAFMALLVAGPASAQLYALNYDRSTGNTTLATVNATDGALSDVGSGAPACCEVAMSANAFDPFAQQLLAFGPSAADPAISVLYRFDLATGAGALVGSVSLPGRIVGAVFEQSTQRLLALRQLSATQLDLLAVDTTTAAAVVVNPGIADCCDLIPGAVAERSGVFYLLGRVRGGADPQSLIGFSTSSATVTQLPIATPLVALVKDRSSNTLYGLQQLRSAAPVNHSLQLVSIDVVSAALTPVGTAAADCCAIAPDTVAINGGALRAVGTRVGNSGFDLISMDLATGTASFSSAPMASNRIVDGLFDGLKGLLPSSTSIVSISPSPSEVGQSYTVNVSVSSMSGTPTGDVIVSDGNGAQCTIVLPATSCQLTSVVAGALIITADYGGDANFAGSSDSAPHTVDRATSSTVITSIVPTPSTIGQAYTVSVSVSGFGSPTGDVAVDDGAGAMCTITLPAGSCMLTSTVVGSKTISASYPGDALNLPSSATALHDVLRAASVTTITGVAPAASSIVGQAYTVGVSVTGFGVPMGNVVINDGAGASCTVVLPAGSCNLTSTNAGPVTLTASYGGDVNNLPSSDTELYTIDRAPSTTTIATVVPSPSVAGQAYAVTVSVTGFGTPTGSIAVDDGAGASCTITLPAASCNLTSPTAGAKTLTASYSGDINNLPSTSTLAHTVNPAPTTTTLTAAPDPALAGQPVALTAAVGGGVNPTGTVDFLDGGNPIATCSAVPVSGTSAVCNTSFPNANPRSLSANYSGDANNTGSTGLLTLTVNLNSTTTVINSVAPTPSIIGQPYTVTVAVTGFGPPTGVVNVDDGAGATCSFPLPAVSCVLTSTVVGPKTLTAAYSGDPLNATSSGTLAHVVEQAPSTTSITGIVPAGSSVIGQPYAVSISVSGFGVPTGSVQVADGAGANCTVTLPATSCNLVSTVAGAKTITAVYSGDVNNLASSASANYSIERAPSTTSIDLVQPSPGIVGQLYAVTVSVTGFGAPTGSVVVDDGTGASCTVTLPAASCNLSSQTAGAKTLTASYSGDANNLPSSATAAQTVNPAPTTTALSAVPNPAIVGQTVVLTATVSGGVNTTGTVAFLDGANPIAGCAAVTLAAGTASCSTSFSPEGTRNLVANYSGDANNLASSGALTLPVERVPTTTTLTASPLAVVVGDPVQLSISVSGGVAPLSGTVSITANGVALPVCQNLVLNGNGQTSCVVSFADFNVYQLVASYSGDIDDLPSSGTASVTVTAIKVPALGGPGLLLLGLLMAGLVLLPGVRRQL